MHRVTIRGRPMTYDHLRSGSSWAEDGSSFMIRIRVRFVANLLLVNSEAFKNLLI